VAGGYRKSGQGVDLKIGD